MKDLQGSEITTTPASPALVELRHVTGRNMTVLDLATELRLWPYGWRRAHLVEPVEGFEQPPVWSPYEGQLDQCHWDLARIVFCEGQWRHLDTAKSGCGQFRHMNTPVSGPEYQAHPQLR